MSKISWRTKCLSWTVCSLTFLYGLSLSMALPPMNSGETGQQLAPPTAQPPMNQSAAVEHAHMRGTMSIGQPRQAAFLAAIGAAIAPFFANLISPILSALATAVSNAILGKLQGSPDLNLTAAESSHYEAYMINVPNETGPYLLLTTAANGASADSRRPTPSVVSAIHSQVQPPMVKINSRPQPSVKVTQHLGTVNVKPYVPYNTDRHPGLPDNPVYTDENHQEELEES